ncbi:MAG TPA: carboxypeptidase-like regulatory domain-containing protein, partial [Phnomibacter sp.]|nr:carboxypeptidase-like regulatory domain-containing protein [Phnomibacter sp.]
MKIKLIWFFPFVLFALAAMAQKVPVRGSVKDVSGILLAGITVSEVGTTNAVVTDEKGTFMIDVNKGARLQFSGVGFQTLTVAADQQNIDIMLETKVEELKDVVVTAL